MKRRAGPVPWDDQGARRALARRRRRRRIRITVAWGLLGGVTLGVVVGLAEGGHATLTWLRTNTHLFEVRTVDVVRTSSIPPWEVVNASGVEPGDDILAVEPDSVTARIERHPRVARASVRRTLTRALRIEIEERPPVALFMARVPMEVSADGTVLGSPPLVGELDWLSQPSGVVRGVALPLLTGSGRIQVAPGEVLEDAALGQALAFLARLRAYGNPGEAWISEVRAADSEDLEAVTLHGGIRVKIGDGRLSRRKITALQAVLDQVMDQAAEVEFLDARFRHQVIVKRS